MSTLHAPTWRLHTALFVLFLTLAVQLGISLPDRYPIHFNAAGEPTTWEERGKGMWIFLVAIATLSFGQLHLFQRFLLSNPDTTLLNLPHREAFLKLPRERRIPVLRRMNRMMGLLGTSLLVTFLAILLMTWWSAHQPGGWQARLAHWTLWAAIAFACVYPILEAFLVSRMVRRKVEEEGLLSEDAGSSA